jgi:hypothetical protein
MLKMTKEDKFNNQLYIMNCTMPSELFTVKGIKTEYRKLAKMWHPDVADVQEALFIMSKINALYKEGLVLIAQNKFYEKERLIHRRRAKVNVETQTQYERETQPPVKRSKKKRVIEIQREGGKCVRFKYLKRIMVELGFMYISETHILLEITKLKRKIFMDGIDLVRRSSEGYFKVPVPDIVDSFDSKTHGYIVMKKERGVEPIVVLETIEGYLKHLGSRKLCEGIFYDLTALKHMGLTSTGLERDLLFVNVSTGKLYNLGLYFYLHEFNAKLSRAPQEVSDSLLHLRPKDNESLVIDLVKDLILKLNSAYKLKVDDFHQWLMQLKSDSLEMSLAESQVFNRSIVSVTTHGFDLDSYYAAISNG